MPVTHKSRRRAAGWQVRQVICRAVDALITWRAVIESISRVSIENSYSSEREAVASSVSWEQSKRKASILIKLITLSWCSKEDENRISLHRGQLPSLALATISPTTSLSHPPPGIKLLLSYLLNRSPRLRQSILVVGVIRAAFVVTHNQPQF